MLIKNKRKGNNSIDDKLQRRQREREIVSVLCLFCMEYDIDNNFRAFISHDDSSHGFKYLAKIRRRHRHQIEDPKSKEERSIFEHLD
jgi:hypothetical protein